MKYKVYANLKRVGGIVKSMTAVKKLIKDHMHDHKHDTISYKYKVESHE